MMDIRNYKIVSCEEYIAVSGNRSASKLWSKDLDVSIPAITYGQIDPPAFPYWEWPPNNWYEASYSIKSPKHYVFEDAHVHTETGVITIGEYCLKESLYLVFPEAQGWPKSTDFEIAIPVLATTEVEEGFHALCGYVGNRNYAHWWIDVVPVLGRQLMSQCFGAAVPLIPKIRAKYQAQTLDLIPELKDTIIEISDCSTVHVKKLHFVPSLTGGDYHPQPKNLEFIHELKARVGQPKRVRGTRRIYLSRRDAPARRMENEDHICEIASRIGFEVIEASGLSLADQIKVFSEASHFISPHGAGLANMLFCPVGTKILELHYDNSVNWSLRRLAAACNHSYGCLIGTQNMQLNNQTSEESKENSWFLPVDRFEETISTSPFL